MAFTLRLGAVALGLLVLLCSSCTPYADADHGEINLTYNISIIPVINYSYNSDHH